MKFQQYLQKITPMPDEKADEIYTYYKEERLEKHTLIIQEGKTSTKSYYLESGFIRCFVIDSDGNEVTTRIFSAPDVLNDYLSFFKKQPSQENYETISPCTVQIIELEAAQDCFHNIPEFREWGRMCMILNYVAVHQRMLSLLKETAEGRYLDLLHNHPEIMQNIPLKIIASFIGVTDTSLSRIRKELAKK